MKGMHELRGKLTVVALLMGLGFAACGGDGDVAASNPPDVAAGGDVGDEASEESAVGGAGESGGSVSAGAAVGDFPIPAPDGLLLDVLADVGLALDGQRQLYYESDDFDRVVMFYDDWTSQNGEWSRGEAEGTVVFQGLDGSGIRQITITPGHDPGAQAAGPVTFVVLVAA